MTTYRCTAKGCWGEHECDSFAQRGPESWRWEDGTWHHRHDCPECDGAGGWPIGDHTDPYEACGVCGGTGRIWIPAERVEP